MPAEVARVDLDDTAWWLQSDDPILPYLRALRDHDPDGLGVLAANVTTSADGSPESRGRLLDRIRAVVAEAG